MRVTGVLLCLGLAGCGGSSPASPGPPPSPNQPTIVIAAGGVVSPKELTVAPGTRVLFRNNDTRAHNMRSDPHPDHTDCPEIDQVGVLNPGQSRETGNLVAVRTCGFHDHDSFPNANLEGRIVIR